jgi:hypothetical protein
MIRHPVRRSSRPRHQQQVIQHLHQQQQQLLVYALVTVVLLELLAMTAASVNAEDAGCCNMMQVKIPIMMKPINNVTSLRGVMEVMEVINRIHHHQLHLSHQHQSRQLRPLHLHQKFVDVSFRRHLHLHHLLRVAPRLLPRIRVMEQRVVSRVASGVMIVDSRLMVKVNAALGFE